MSSSKKVFSHLSNIFHFSNIQMLFVLFFSLHTKINGNRTLAENIADNGGVKVALHAYQSWLENHGSNETINVPGGNFTENQIFFLAFAQVGPCQV